MRSIHKHHRIYGEGLFQRNYHVFSIAKGISNEWWVFIRNIKTFENWYIGKVKDAKLDLFQGAYKGHIGMYIRWHEIKLREIVTYRWLHLIEPCSDICYTREMTKRRIPERDREIFDKITNLKWTFRQVGRHYGMAVSSVHEAYEREVKRNSTKTVRVGRLSTAS